MLNFWSWFILLTPGVHTATAEPLVTIPKSHVTYCGTLRDSVEHFKNIKFAHDASGNLGFAPLVPFSPPPGTEIDASAPGSACPQMRAALPPFFDETKNTSEDCLNLRVARPAGTISESKLPVVVWLHRGGVVKGSAYDFHSEPDNLINLSRDLGNPVMYVSIHYRLTIFGFSRMPILKDQRSLNLGIRDQRVGFQSKSSLN
jgi:carboxylesterase type B